MFKIMNHFQNRVLINKLTLKLSSIYIKLHLTQMLWNAHTISLLSTLNAYTLKHVCSLPLNLIVNRYICKSSTNIEIENGLGQKHSKFKNFEVFSIALQGYSRFPRIFSAPVHPLRETHKTSYTVNMH